MTNIVFLNSAKLDFRNELNFISLSKLGNFRQHNSSNPAEILERVRDQDVLITKELLLDAKLIEKFPSSVKLICEAGTGYNNIDIEAANRKGIKVSNVPGYSTQAVAQLAITFILSLVSSIIQQQIMIKQNLFDNFTQYIKLPIFEIQKKTLGIIGFGDIGQEVAKIAKALGMNILAYTRTPKINQFPEIAFVDLKDLLQQSDFVSLHCPLTPVTNQIINKDNLALMKSTSFVINTARGGLIDEKALISFLQKGKIAGAGLDVQNPEPPETTNPLFSMKNVILTPHIGWKPIETRQRLIELIAENIKNFIKGILKNIVS